MKINFLRQIIFMSKCFIYGVVVQCMLFTAILAKEASAQKSVHELSLSIVLKNSSIEDVFKSIEQETGFGFMYNAEIINDKTRISTAEEGQTLGELLHEISKNTKLKFRRINNTIVVDRRTSKQDYYLVEDFNEIKITGKVISDDGESLPGVTIVEKGTTNGTTTDIEGNYALTVSGEGAILLYSFVGYSPQEVVVGSNSVLDVEMALDQIGLEEVVVTALGVKSKKKSLGYSTSNIMGESVALARESNVANSLSGKVAGLVITPASAGMGGSTRVIIRGNSSITGNNEPLYIVDGIPINNSGFGGSSSTQKGINAFRSDYGNGISDINPSDIESISVLKGPNAAALYGSRASNGVIIITTKQGAANKGIGVSYTANVMVSKINESTMPDFQNEYGQGSGSSFANDGLFNWGSKFDNSSYTTVKGVQKTYTAQPNNVKDFYQTGVERVHTLGLEGGTEDARVRFSYTNFSGTGIVPNSTLYKNNFNLRGNVRLSDKLTFDSKVTYFTQHAKGRTMMGWTDDNTTMNVYRWVRNAETADFLDYGDEYSGPQVPYSVNPALNPYWIQYKNTNADERDRIQGFAKVDYEFNDKFSAFVRVGTDALSHKITNIYPYGHFRDPLGKRSDVTNWVAETNADFLVSYNDKISSSLNLNLNVGGNYKYRIAQRSAKSGDDFKIPTSVLYSNLTTVIGSESRRRSSVYSLYFSGTLDYEQKVYLNFTGRNDWDSQMWTPTGSSSDFSFFYPSLSMSFLGNDIFNVESSVLSFSKLRLAWSEVGSGGFKNDEVNYYLSEVTGYNGLITVTKSDIFDDNDLKPESTQSIELGLEFKFFNNRLYTDFTYYKTNTFDQILNAPVDASTGFNFMRTNVGEVQNKGFEFLLGGTPIQTSDFYWDASINLAKNTNQLVSFIEGTDSYLFTNYQSFAVKTKVGGYYGDIYGRDYVYHNGKIVVNQNGLPIASEETLLGNYQPDMTGGLSNTFGYKNLEFSFLIDFRKGGEAYSMTQRELGQRGSITSTLEGRDGMVLDAYVNTGTEESPVYETNTQEINAENHWSALAGIERAHIQDLSNIRLREMSLSYSLPGSLLDHTFIRSASLSLVGRNLFFISKKADGVDPEASVAIGNNGQGAFYYNMPSTRRFGFNLNVTF